MHIPVAVCAIGGPCEGKLHVLERWRSVLPQFDIIRFDTSNLLINKNGAAAETTIRVMTMRRCFMANLLLLSVGLGESELRADGREVSVRTS